MTLRWAYAALLPPDGKLDWGGDWNGNIPEAGLLPDLQADAFEVISQLVRFGHYDGKQLDWGAKGIIVDADGLRNVINYIYGARSDASSPAQAYFAYANTMLADDRIVLIACEL